MRIINLLKTGLLFAILTGLLMGIGYLFGGSDAVLPFFLISLVMNFVGYWFSDRLALMMAGAEALDRTQAPQLYAEVEDLARSMNLPIPRLYISHDPQPNAFATGRGPKHAAVCVTQGLIELLDPEEIRGVLAHELGHIKNRDVLFATLAAVMAGAISSLAHMGYFFGGSHSDEEEGDSVAGNFLMLLLAPIAASLIQLAISRSREYGADTTGAEVTGRPLALAHALVKIENYAQRLPVSSNPALSSLYIQNPFSGKGIVEWFSTHPSTEKRVERLQRMASKLEPHYRRTSSYAM